MPRINPPTLHRDKENHRCSGFAKDFFNGLLDRINKLRASAPVATLAVRDMEAFLSERTLLRESRLAKGQRFEEPIFAVPLNRAITVHGVHIYANLVDFNTYLSEYGEETEASHQRSMRFLHGHYEACDQLISAYGIQRVDFHGARLHAVVLTPTGAEMEGARLEIALSFAAAFRELVAQMSDRYGPELRSRVRIGIDTGPAVAINSGRRGELEPLFIGSPANHAAKAAIGEGDGIVLTSRARRVLQESRGTVSPADRTEFFDGIEEGRVLQKAVFVGGRHASARLRVDEAFARFDTQYNASIGASTTGQRTEFTFHFRHPPLRTIDYSKHPPSNAIRMPLASLFADIDGFTSYVDNAIQIGTVAEAVANLHVMRGEMNYVVRDDFEGRKVRYVGDCLHAVLADGDARQTDERNTIRTAVLAGAGIRSSFDLCRQLLPGASDLGIAIGIELGQTPIARLGLRGDASVRCASSRATCISEEVQNSCNGSETGIGSVALAAADSHVRRLFANGRHARNLGYATAVTLLSGASVTAAAMAPSISRPESKPMRAYLPE